MTAAIHQSPPLVFATQHPVRGDSYVPSRHAIAFDLGEYMTFRGGVILGRLLSVSMEVGWQPGCVLRQIMAAELTRRGIAVPAPGGWVQVEYQAVPPPLWFFDGRYAALRDADGTLRFLCWREQVRPECVSDVGVLFDWIKGDQHENG